MELKKALWQRCREFVTERKDNLLQFMASNRQALESETKSSAGDKHETGRAMLQLEMEKTSKQLEDLEQMEEVLKRIDPAQSHDRARLGSLVATSTGHYFISISAGEVLVNGADRYYCLSPLSPMGKVLLGSSKGDVLDFRSREVVVLDVL